MSEISQKGLKVAKADQIGDRHYDLLELEHSPEVGPAKFFFLNFLHENGKVPSSICPDTN